MTIPFITTPWNIYDIQTLVAVVPEHCVWSQFCWLLELFCSHVFPVREVSTGWCSAGDTGEPYSECNGVEYICPPEVRSMLCEAALHQRHTQLWNVSTYTDTWLTSMVNKLSHVYENSDHYQHTPSTVVHAAALLACIHEMTHCRLTWHRFYGFPQSLQIFQVSTAV